MRMFIDGGRGDAVRRLHIASVWLKSVKRANQRVPLIAIERSGRTRGKMRNGVAANWRHKIMFFSWEKPS